jgi:hypothetical protein
MRFGSTTTRHLMVLVVIAAVWLAFVARAHRLRRIAAEHMAHYIQRPYDVGSDREFIAIHVGPKEAWHLKMATKYNVEADFVEAFQLALLLAFIAVGAAMLVGNVRRARLQRNLAGSHPNRDHQ